MLQLDGEGKGLDMTHLLYLICLSSPTAVEGKLLESTSFSF